MIRKIKKMFVGEDSIQTSVQIFSRYITINFIRMYNCLRMLFVICSINLSGSVIDGRSVDPDQPPSNQDLDYSLFDFSDKEVNSVDPVQMAHMEKFMQFWTKSML